MADSYSDKVNEVPDDYGAMTVNDLTDIRISDQNYFQWRYDAAIAEEYAAGNQFTLDDIEAAESNGIALTVANYVKPILDDIRGVQESALTSWRVRGEDPRKDSIYRALGAQLFRAAKVADSDRARIKAYGSQINVGVGWLEVGRQRNPLLGKYFVDDVPWREMFFDMRSRKADLSDAQYVHRVKNFPAKQIAVRFSHVPDIEQLIEAAPRPSQMQWMNVEPPQNYRPNQYAWRTRGRDVPLAYQNTPEDRKLRALEEVWYPVHLEGLFLEFDDGHIVLFDDDNPMHKLAVANTLAKPVTGEWVRWRCALWCGDTKLDDCWSPYPWHGHKYIALYGYREGMTNVPFGITRGLQSLQDEINSAAAKFHFGMDAVRIILEDGALSDSMSIQQVKEQAANKRGIFILKQGKMDRLKFDHHFQLNEQNFKRAQDAKQDLRNVSGVAGLNPGQVSGAKGVTDDTMNAVLLRALANLGEIAGNYREASQVLGQRLLSMINEDTSRQGNVQVDYEHPTRGHVSVTLHAEVGLHPEYGQIIANDVTMLKADVGLDDVPHTVTYRAQQLSDNMKMAQSCPPEAVEARTLIMANVVRLSDTPNGEEVAKHMLETAGLAPPSTPEAAAALQKKQQEADMAQQLNVENAMAQIAHRKAQTTKLLSDAELKSAMAQQKHAEAGGEFDQINKQLLLERTAAQNKRTLAQADKIERENQGDQQAAVQPGVPFVPEKW